MILDILIVSIICVSLIWGVFHDHFGEIVSIAGFCAGIFAALNYYYIGSILISPFIEDNTIPRFLSMLIIFAEVYLIVHIAGLIIRNLFGKRPLRPYHRVIGATIGAARGIIVGSVVFILLTAALPKDSFFLRRSILAEHLVKVSRHMDILVSEEIRTQFYENIEDPKKSGEKEG